jgi:uncharacterized protein YycO
LETAFTSLELAALIRDIAITTFLVVGAIALLVGLGLGIAMYRKAKGIVDRVDNGVKRVEDLMETIDSTASTVKRTASSVNQGMRAGAYARSAVGSMFGRRKAESAEDGQHEKSDKGESGK